jgi:hypothetical protein
LLNASGSPLASNAKSFCEAVEPSDAFMSSGWASATARVTSVTVMLTDAEPVWPCMSMAEKEGMYIPAWSKAGTHVKVPLLSPWSTNAAPVGIADAERAVKSPGSTCAVTANVRSDPSSTISIMGALTISDPP